jgi:hypothetical protein
MNENWEHPEYQAFESVICASRFSLVIAAKDVARHQNFSPERIQVVELFSCLILFIAVGIVFQSLKPIT